jgi:hypothetical protein
MRRLAFVALLACVATCGVFALVASTSASSAGVRATPSATEFGRDFVDTANAYAAAHASAARFTRPDCVEASAGRYMCSYGIVQPGRPIDCHLMQARWTPDARSTITVTLAGRTARCESLHAALAALR